MVCLSEHIEAIWESWVTTSTPRDAHEVTSVLNTDRDVVRSSCPVGSSASTNELSDTSARAITTRCSSPPESDRADRRSKGARPTSLSASVAVARASSHETPRARAPRATLSSALLRPSAFIVCKMNEQWRRPSSMASPTFTPALPLWALISPPMRAKSVVLPEPEGPITARTCPGLTEKFASWSTVRSPYLWVNPSATSRMTNGIGRPSGLLALFRARSSRAKTPCRPHHR